VLKDGTQLIGVAQEGKEGTLDIKTAAILQPTTVALDAITAINPPGKKPITYKGHLGLGLSISDGNTHNKSFSFLGDFEARSERQRLALSGAYNYAQNQTDVTQRNGKAELKYDFFITKRLFVFASSLFEYDFFQDLNLRSVLGAGPGFQVIDKGDFAEDYRKEMQLYGEAGLAYFSEDHRNAADDQFLAARWAIKFDWPVVPQKVAFFHKHEGFPSLESAKDLYITTEQGVRLSVWGNFVATLQVNWRWDNTPAPGFSRSDTLYLITLGYSFEL
jgi:putative salt-induced outer membrane protein YdiY